MNNKDDFDVFLSQNFTRFSGNEDVYEWLNVTEGKFNKLRIVRSFRRRAIPMLVAGDAEQKYLRIREYIRTFDDFYIFLTSIYYSGDFASSEAEFYRKLLEDSFDEIPNARIEPSDIPDDNKIESFTGSKNILPSASVANHSVPLEEKVVPIVTDSVSNELCLMPRISADNMIIPSTSPDALGSEQETFVTLLDPDTNIGAANILGVIPAEQVPTFNTEHSLAAIGKGLMSQFQLNDHSLKKNFKSSAHSEIYPLRWTIDINYSLNLFLYNYYRLDFISGLLRTNFLRRHPLFIFVSKMLCTII